jgi:mevalonate kinase
VLGATLPDLTITLRSDIPIAGGMGSGAAVATTLVRALAAHVGGPLAAADISELVYNSEQRYHGTPSGIDNAVVAFEQAIWFERDGRSAMIEPVEIGEPLHLVIGDTGVRSETRLSVGEVRQRWQAAPQEYQMLFNGVDYVVRQIRIALASGDITSLGLLLNENQELLEQIGVSSPELEHLIAAALTAGAWGAKLSGGGWGGIMVALVDEESSASVAAALRKAGAAQVREATVR